MKRIAVFVLVVLVNSGLTGLWAQKIAFRNYTIKDGLPQNSVLCMHQDREGYIWFGTQVGVSRFDGKNFINFDISQGLPDNNISFILQDSRRRMWFATQEGGVAVMEGRKFRIYNQKNGLLDNKVISLLEDNTGNIWCRTHYGVSIISSDTVVSYDQNSGLPHNNVMCFFQDSKFNVWIGTQGGIAKYSKGKFTSFVKEVTYSFSKGQSESTIWSITEDKAGQIWFGTQGGGVYVWDGKQFRNYTSRDGLADDIVLSLFTDKQGTVWMGHYGRGLTSWNGKSFQKHGQNLISSDNVIMQILEDKKGNIWGRTLSFGVLMGKAGNFRLLNSINNLIDDQAQDILLDANGNVWIGTLGGVSKYGKAIFEEFNTEYGLPDNNILSLATDRDGSVWAGTIKNLIKIKDNRVEIIRNSKGYSYNDQILSLMKEGGNLWIGSYGGDGNAGIMRYNGFSTQYFNYKVLGSGYNGVYDIFYDTKDNLWLATELGCYIYNGRTFHTLNTENGIISDDVKGLYQDEFGQMWIATLGGISVKMTDTILNFSTQQGLPNLICTDISGNGNGKVWVATEGGVVEFHSSKDIDSIRVRTSYTKSGKLASNTIFSLVFDGTYLWIGHERGLNRLDPKTSDIRYYGALDGFSPLENNQNSSAVAPDGSVWFGTVAGLVKYCPWNDSLQFDAPRTYVTGLRFPESEVNLEEYCDSIDNYGLPVNLKLPYSIRTLSLDFIGIHFTVPEKVQYQYLLEGYDDSWSQPSTQTYADYKKLPNGHYTFLLKAANSDGKWNEEPIRFSFTIRPPFYKTWWFLSLVVIFAVALISAYIRYRERKLLEEKKILEQKVKERTIELEEANTELREQKQEIEAQRDEIERQRDVTAQQRDQIAFQKKEIMDSIHYARRIQTAILPSDEKANLTLPEHFILFKPRDIVSGDFYWMTRKDKKLVIVAADCTGHGVPGAFMSMLGVSLLNEIVNKENVFGADEILNRLRFNVKATLSQTGKENEAKDGMDIALCVIDEEARVVQYAGANNPIYLVRNNELIETKADGMPIGIYVGDEKPFTRHDFPYQTGDVFYIFTDGYADQFGGPDGGKFKTKPFKRLVVAESAKPMKDQKISFEQTIESWKGSLDQVDDILVIGFRLV